MALNGKSPSPDKTITMSVKEYLKGQDQVSRHWIRRVARRVQVTSKFDLELDTLVALVIFVLREEDRLFRRAYAVLRMRNSAMRQLSQDINMLLMCLDVAGATALFVSTGWTCEISPMCGSSSQSITLPISHTAERSD